MVYYISGVNTVHESKYFMVFEAIAAESEKQAKKIFNKKSQSMILSQFCQQMIAISGTRLAVVYI